MNKIIDILYSCGLWPVAKNLSPLEHHMKMQHLVAARWRSLAICLAIALVATVTFIFPIDGCYK